MLPPLLLQHPLDSWVRPRASMNVVVKRKTHAPTKNCILAFQQVASLFTETSHLILCHYYTHIIHGSTNQA
jgi:hypothetical protein